VLVPSQAGPLSAFGAIVSDIAHEFSAARFERSKAMRLGELNGLLADLTCDARRFLARTGRPTDTWTVEGLCEARYVGQIWELTVDLPSLALDDATLVALVDRFHSVHERTFGFAERDQELEFLQWRVRGTARTEPAHLAPSILGGGESMRNAYFGEEHGWLAARVLGPERVTKVGDFAGPAVVQELNTTVVVPPDWRLNAAPGTGYLLTRVSEVSPLAQLTTSVEVV
jgi:N-methylhydantoinase A